MNKFKKPDEYITFASGWTNTNENDEMTSVRCSIDPTKNGKANKGKAVKVYLVPVDEKGEQLGDPVEITSFAVVPSNVDKGQYPSAPDWRIFAGINH